MHSLFEDVATAHPDWSDEQVVIHICERLLADGEIEPPVDVNLIASLCGIVDVEYRSEGPPGMLACQNGAWVASVRADDGLERQRFSVLHEGGHTLLPGFKRGGTHHRCKGRRTREEQLCDLAAAEFLLPRSFFVADLPGAGSGLDGVESLAQSYVASLQATARRVVDLTEKPMGMMVFQMANKPADRGREDARPPKLRIEYVYSSDKLPFPLRHKSAPDKSPFQRAWNNEPTRERIILDEYFAQPVGSCLVDARRYGDRVLAIVEPV